MANQILLRDGVRLSLERLASASLFQRIAQWVAESRGQSWNRLSELPMRHEFMPGLYLRQIFMPRGWLVVSRVHLTEHPYILSAGKVLVWTPTEQVRVLQAPYTGITKPGTFRVLLILEDAVWTTIHATELTNPEQVVEEITLDPAEVLTLLPTVVQSEGGEVNHQFDQVCRLEQ